jgi:hypothetical protein
MVNIRSKCSVLVSQMVSRSGGGRAVHQDIDAAKRSVCRLDDVSRSGSIGKVRADEDGSAAQIFACCGHREPTGFVAPVMTMPAPPRLANCRATAAPRPCVDPVTTATLSSKSPLT